MQMQSLKPATAGTKAPESLYYEIFLAPKSYFKLMIARAFVPNLLKFQSSARDHRVSRTTEEAWDIGLKFIVH
jgi:hypothetical protein